MKRAFSRREFLRNTTCLAAAAGMARLSASAAYAESKPAGLCVSCRDSHLKVTEERDCWMALRKIGAEGVEASIQEDLSLPGLYHPSLKYSVATPEGIARLAADLKAANQRITAFCMSNRYDERPQFEIEWGAKVAQAAKALQIPAIRIDVWPHKLGRAEFLKLSIETLKKLIDATESTGVAFAIENHGSVTNDPEFLQPLFDGVGSKRLGLTLDTGNFYWYGHPLSKVYEIFQTYASRVFHTHCKSIGFPEPEREKRRPMGWKYEEYNKPIYAGDIDFHRVVEILRKAGYSNDLCVEDESLAKFPAPERGEVLAKEIRLLKSLR